MEFEGVTARVVVVAVAALAGGAKKPQNKKADKSTTRPKELFVRGSREKQSACTIEKVFLALRRMRRSVRLVLPRLREPRSTFPSLTDPMVLATQQRLKG
jgi:hypothetical protein